MKITKNALFTNAEHMWMYAVQ